MKVWRRGIDRSLEIKNFAQRIQKLRAIMSASADKTLVDGVNPGIAAMPFTSGSSEARDTERLFEAMLVLEEFCTELRAIVEVKQAMYRSAAFPASSPTVVFPPVVESAFSTPRHGISSPRATLDSPSTPKKALHFPATLQGSPTSEDLP